MLTSSDIARVLTCYDLGTAEGIAATGHGFVNETVIVSTERGKFVVRRNHRRFTLAALQYRHRLITRLHGQCFPTARLIPACDGSTLTIVDGRYYEVLEYISGADYDPQRISQIYAVGAALARFHAATADCAAPGEALPPRYAPARICALSETLYERDVMGEFHETLAWYDGRAAELRAILPDTAYAALPRTLIHGDMHPDNIRFHGDQVAALLDFDQIEEDARIVDLADALVGFTSLATQAEAMSWGVFRGPLNPQHARHLISGYGGITPLSATELAMLPALIEVLWLRGELGRVISTAEGAPDYHHAVLHQGKRLSAWIQQQSAELIREWETAVNQKSEADVG